MARGVDEWQIVDATMTDNVVKYPQKHWVPDTAAVDPACELHVDRH
jgi:hypothetical protein